MCCTLFVLLYVLYVVGGMLYIYIHIILGCVCGGSLGWRDIGVVSIGDWRDIPRARIPE